MINKCQKDDVIILDVPLLFESKLNYLCDKIVLIYCSQINQIKHLKNRNINDDDLIFNPNDDFLTQEKPDLPKFVDMEEKVKFDKFYEKAKAKEELKHEYAIKTYEEKQRMLRQTINEAKDNQVHSIVFSDDYKLAKEFQDELDKEYSVDQITNNVISYRTFLYDSYLEKCLANMYDKINEGREVKVAKDSANNKYIPYDNRTQIYHDPIQLKLLWENVPAEQKAKRIKVCKNALELMFEYITNGSLTPRFCLFWFVMFGLEEFNLKIYKQKYYDGFKKVQLDKDGNVKDTFLEIDPNEIISWTEKINSKRKYRLAKMLNDLFYKYNNYSKEEILNVVEDLSFKERALFNLRYDEE